MAVDDNACMNEVLLREAFDLQDLLLLLWESVLCEEHEAEDQKKFHLLSSQIFFKKFFLKGKRFLKTGEIWKFYFKHFYDSSSKVE